MAGGQVGDLTIIGPPADASDLLLSDTWQTAAITQCAITSAGMM
jgi:hypothetical protein